MNALGCAGGCGSCQSALAGSGCAGGMGRGAGLGSLVSTSAEDIRGLLIRYGVVFLVGAVAGVYVYRKVTRKRRRR